MPEPTTSTVTQELDPERALRALFDGSDSSVAAVTTPAASATEPTPEGTTASDPAAAPVGTQTDATPAASATSEQAEEQPTSQEDIFALADDAKIKLETGEIIDGKDLKGRLMMKSEYTRSTQELSKREKEIERQEQFVKQYVSTLNTIAENPILHQLTIAAQGGADEKTLAKLAVTATGLDKEISVNGQAKAPTTELTPETILAEKPPEHIQWGTKEYDEFRDKQMLRAMDLVRQNAKRDLEAQLKEKDAAVEQAAQASAAKINEVVKHNTGLLEKAQYYLEQEIGAEYESLTPEDRTAIIESLEKAAQAEGFSIRDKAYLQTNRLSNAEVKLAVKEAAPVIKQQLAAKTAATATPQFTKPPVERKPAPLSGGGPSNGGPARAVGANAAVPMMDDWQSKLRDLG